MSFDGGAERRLVLLILGEQPVDAVLHFLQLRLIPLTFLRQEVSGRRATRRGFHQRLRIDERDLDRCLGGGDAAQTRDQERERGRAKCGTHENSEELEDLTELEMNLPLGILPADSVRPVKSISEINAQRT